MVVTLAIELRICFLAERDHHLSVMTLRQVRVASLSVDGVGAVGGVDGVMRVSCEEGSSSAGNDSDVGDEVLGLSVDDGVGGGDVVMRLFSCGGGSSSTGDESDGVMSMSLDESVSGGDGVTRLFSC